MRSSAMRDLMAITSRPEVISLAGGLPDTSTFPPASFAAQMTRIAQESAARPSSTGRPRASRRRRTASGEVMAAEGMQPDPEDVIVTTGGQQAIDLIAKTLVDPGDPVICEAPDLPGRGAGLLRLRGRRPPGDDRRRRDADRRARGAARPPRRRGPAAEVHLLGAELPEPRRGDALGGAAAAAGRDRARARGARGRGQPLRAAPLRGRARGAPLQARRRRLRDLHRHLLQDPLARDPPRLAVRAAAGDGEDRARKAGRRTSAPRP